MIRVEDLGDEGFVRHVTIDRPERRNAVDHESLEALRFAVAGAAHAGTRVLVLSGAGGNFCAGADLTGVEDTGFVTLLHHVLTDLQSATFPTIAAVDGAALGAGTQLAVACDLRMATADATFGIPAAKLGLMVDHWTVRRLRDLAGEGPARAMLLAAETYRGDRAVELGFVQRAGSVADALVWATEVSRLAPLTIAGHKIGMNTADIDGGDARYADAFSRAWSSEDLQEGLAAFRDRRPPEFTGA